MVKLTAPTLNESMKLIVGNYLNSIQPTDLFFGTVTNVSPLTVQIDQKHIIPENFLVLSTLVKDHEVDMTVSMETVEDAYMKPEHTHTGNLGSPTDAGNLDTTHHHDIKGRKKIILHYGLKTGEKVLLLRMQGGQMYLILDRVETPICEGEWI